MADDAARGRRQGKAFPLLVIQIPCYNILMAKYSFIIVGSGWRSFFYVRIAKALPELFEVKALLCRSQEKADLIAREHNIHTTTSIEECKALKSDFVVVAVNKDDLAKVAEEWSSYGFTVLMETPAALDENTLCRLWDLHKAGRKILVAEQYIFYPEYASILKILDSRLTGSRDFLSCSLAHDYHGASIIRYLLDAKMEQFTVTAQVKKFPGADSFNRYKQFTDGNVSDKKRVLGTIDFESGKTCLLDFDEQQYRSSIRGSYFKLQGKYGELMGTGVTHAKEEGGGGIALNDITLRWLDEKFEPQQATCVIESKIHSYKNENPNLAHAKEITSVTFDGKKLYEPYFGERGLCADETAIAHVMEGCGNYNAGGEPFYPLKEALQDAYLGILLTKACESGEIISSRKMPWME